jgi:hypothetical protein
MKGTIALEFGNGFRRKFTPRIKKMLLDLINNPNHVNWNIAYNCVLRNDNALTTLFMAVKEKDPKMASKRPEDGLWSHIPSKETIVQAINNVILKDERKHRMN